VPGAGNPQALNRYAYALNNPLKLVDPSGHDPKDWFDRQWIDEFRHNHQNHDPTADDYAYRFWTMAKSTGLISQYAANYGVDPQSLDFVIPSKAYGSPEDVDLGQDLWQARHMLPSTWINYVRPYGRWDYKQTQPHWKVDYKLGDAGDFGLYEGFGNFAFGFTGRANGWAKQQLLIGAGGAQRGWDIYLTLQGKTPNAADQGIPLPGYSPYGDDPRDQVMAALGSDFYDVFSSVANVAPIVSA
jgi:hypothetical protein